MNELWGGFGVRSHLVIRCNIASLMETNKMEKKRRMLLSANPIGPLADGTKMTTYRYINIGSEDTPLVDLYKDVQQWSPTMTGASMDLHLTHRGLQITYIRSTPYSVFYSVIPDRRSDPTAEPNVP